MKTENTFAESSVSCCISNTFLIMFSFFSDNISVSSVSLFNFLCSLCAWYPRKYFCDPNTFAQKLSLIDRTCTQLVDMKFLITNCAAYATSLTYWTLELFPLASLSQWEIFMLITLTELTIIFEDLSCSRFGRLQHASLHIYHGNHHWLLREELLQNMGWLRSIRKVRWEMRLWQFSFHLCSF